MKTLLAIIATVACLAFVAPIIVLLYAMVLGSSSPSETQVAAAWFLLLPGVLTGGAAMSLWGDLL